MDHRKISHGSRSKEGNQSIRNLSTQQRTISSVPLLWIWINWDGKGKDARGEDKNKGIVRVGKRERARKSSRGERIRRVGKEGFRFVNQTSFDYTSFVIGGPRYSLSWWRNRSNQTSDYLDIHSTTIDSDPSLEIIVLQ